MCPNKTHTHTQQDRNINLRLARTVSAIATCASGQTDSQQNQEEGAQKVVLFRGLALWI